MFSYSPSGGFSREAEILRVSGKTGSLRKVEEYAVTDSVLKQSSQLREKFKTEVRAVEKEKD